MGERLGVTFSVQLVAVAALVLAGLTVRATTRNRHVRRRQRLTLLLSLAWLALELALSWGAVPAAFVEQARGIGSAGLALAVINFLVITAVNPLREDRVPDRFPVILQDTLIVALFALAVTLLLRERVLALSAVGAVVVGFALQDTLGNAFAGLAIQTEKPFHVGQWVRVADWDGKVTEITWRATKLRTKDNSFLIVPNNVMSREAVLNYSEPVLPTRIWIDVGATYERPPNEVKAAVLEAVANAPLALKDPKPEVLLYDFASSAIVYRARFWIEDFGRDEAARDQVRTAVWYSFRRHGIEIPWPIQVEYHREDAPRRPEGTTERLARTLGRVDVFESLGEAERLELADACVERLYAEGEVVVRQGAPGASMFVVNDGEVEVVLEPHGERLALLGDAGFFGEMSLLTGAPRTATVRACADTTLVEITADSFRRFVVQRPSVLERIGHAAFVRRQELERSREAADRALSPLEPPTSFLASVRRFLRLER